MSAPTALKMGPMTNCVIPSKKYVLVMALGMWFSTFTKNQIIAGSISLAAFLLLYVLDWGTAYSTSKWAQTLSSLALTPHFDNFAKGVIDLGDVIYYLSVIGLGIFFTARSVEALKGRP